MWVIGVAVAMLVVLPAGIVQDSWLALVAGREVAHGGIPHHETLTVLSHGRPWIDQQWLAQLWMYWLYRVGGIALVGVANMGLVVLGVAGAALAARRLGAGASSTARVLALVVWVVILASVVRTQPYAYPLFVATLYLLARDSRRPDRSIWWCLPLLVLWGNLHGSVSLGAGLVSLRGLTVFWERRTALLDRVHAWLRPAILTVAPPLCLLVNPYGASIVGYYHATLLNRAFSKFLAEWQPVTASPVLGVLFFVTATITVWSFGRHAGRTTLWERCALLVLAAGAIIAVRSVVWFDLTALVLLPVSIDAAVRSRQRKRRAPPALKLALLILAVAAFGIAFTHTLTSTTSSLEASSPNLALVAVRDAVVGDPRLRVYADVTFADWLLWRLPAVRGRVSSDARYELLSFNQIEAIVNLDHEQGSDWQQAADGFRLLVLDPTTEHSAIAGFERERGRRILYQSGFAVVILRAARR